ncbi:MAG: hypothetical protein KDE55_08220 [Novosphingobium sp.]|nr:hypothetical protein [Novosphingobium sp.]
MATAPLRAESARDNPVHQLPPCRRLRADVPAFDPACDWHLRAWETLWDFSQAAAEPSTRAQLERSIEADIALLDVIDGDIDLEEDQEDCCAAYDDRPYSMGSFGKPIIWTLADDEDAEPENG